MIDRISGGMNPYYTMTPTEVRPTPTPEPTRPFSLALSATAQGASAAVNVLPGGAQVAAAIRGPMTPMSYPTATGPVGGGGATNLTPQGPTLSGAGGVGVSGSVSAGGITVGTGTGVGGMGGVDPSASLVVQEQQLLNEQVAIQMATESFTLQSNVLNAQHTAKEGALQNLRA